MRFSFDDTKRTWEMNFPTQSQPDAGPHETLPNRPLTPLEERQRLLSHHVRLVCRGMTNGLFVHGETGGLGKSKVIQESLINEGANAVLVNSHITALRLYATLFLNRRDAVIWLDDCDGLYRDLKVLGLLRSALWGQEHRVVTYTSSQLPDSLPPSFVFESRIIMTANTLPQKSSAFRAVLSRIDIFSLEASSDEVVELMKAVARQGFENLSDEDCLMVVDFIAQNADGRQLSMRLLEPSFRKLQYARQEGLDWRPLVKSQLQTLGQRSQATRLVDTKSQEMKCLQEAIERFPNSVKDQQSHWCQATDKSRASFFRCLARWRAQNGG